MKRLLTTALVGLALAGCGAGLESAPPDTGSSRTAALTAADACPDTRWVGVSSTTCPFASTSASGLWLRSTLFSTATGAPPVPGLSNYCAYDWEPFVPGTPANLASLPSSAGLPGTAWLAKDCHVVAPLAAPPLSDQSEVWGTLRKSFLRAAGAPWKLPGGREARPSQIRVAVLDTAVEVDTGGKAGYGQSPHGRAVGRAIRELSCPEDATTVKNACIGRLSNHLAMPRVRQDVVDTVNGGFFGTQTDLAQAIFRAVSAWASLPLAERAAQPRLIINLSLGWEPLAGYGGDYPHQESFRLPGPARAVHAAITHAVCNGALVVAAAGNSTGGANPSTGAMYPAAWEAKRAPSLLDCRRFEGRSLATRGYPVLATASKYQPLVYAAGALDATDALLSNARLKGRPALGAYGFHVVSSDGVAAATEVLTGTSMSAAVLSGTAAVVWGYQPTLTAAEVMDVVYASAIPLTPAPVGVLAQTELCLGGGSCAGRQPRRTSVCQALELACKPGGYRCPAVTPACAAQPAYSGQNPSWTPAAWSQALAGVTVTPLPLEQVTPCVAPLCTSADAALPTVQALPFVIPQPWVSGCDVCGFQVYGDDGALYMSLAPGAATWDSVTLTLTGTDGTVLYDLSPITLGALPGDLYQVVGLPVTGTLTSAQVSFGSLDVSTIEPILLW